MRYISCCDNFPGRKEKLLSCNSKARRAELLCGSLLLAHLAPGAVFYTLPSGKPVFRDGGAWLSIAHSSGYVIAVVSDNNVGVDIEPSSRSNPIVRRRYFPDDERPFAESFTRYESFAKYTGEGIFAAFATGIPESLCLKSFSPISGFTATVCSGKEYIPGIRYFSFG